MSEREAVVAVARPEAGKIVVSIITTDDGTNSKQFRFQRRAALNLAIRILEALDITIDA